MINVRDSGNWILNDKKRLQCFPPSLITCKFFWSDLYVIRSSCVVSGFFRKRMTFLTTWHILVCFPAKNKVRVLRKTKLFFCLWKHFSYKNWKKRRCSILGQWLNCFWLSYLKTKSLRLNFQLLSVTGRVLCELFAVPISFSNMKYYRNGRMT